MVALLPLRTADEGYVEERNGARLWIIDWAVSEAAGGKIYLLFFFLWLLLLFGQSGQIADCQAKPFALVHPFRNFKIPLEMWFILNIFDTCCLLQSTMDSFLLFLLDRQISYPNLQGEKPFTSKKKKSNVKFASVFPLFFYEKSLEVAVFLSSTEQSMALPFKPDS